MHEIPSQFFSSYGNFISQILYTQKKKAVEQFINIDLQVKAVVSSSKRDDYGSLHSYYLPECFVLFAGFVMASE